jgi:hypothetical protein
MKGKKIGIILVLIGICFLIIPLGFVAGYSSRKSLIENFGRTKIILKKGEWAVDKKEEENYQISWKEWKKRTTFREFKKLLNDEELQALYQLQQEKDRQEKLAPEPAPLPGEEWIPSPPEPPKPNYIGETSIPYNLIFSLGIISICTGFGLIIWPRNNIGEPH